MGVGFPGSGSFGTLQNAWTVRTDWAGNGREKSLEQELQGLEHSSALPQFP